MNLRTVRLLRFLAGLVLAPVLTLLLAGLVRLDGYWANFVIQLGCFLVGGVLAARVAGRRGWVAVGIGLGVVWIPIAVTVLLSDARPIADLSVGLILVYVSLTVVLTWTLREHVPSHARGEQREPSG